MVLLFFSKAIPTRSRIPWLDLFTGRTSESFNENHDTNLKLLAQPRSQDLCIQQKIDIVVSDKYRLRVEDTSFDDEHVLLRNSTVGLTPTRCLGLGLRKDLGNGLGSYRSTTRLPNSSGARISLRMRRGRLCACNKYTSMQRWAQPA